MEHLTIEDLVNINSGLMRLKLEKLEMVKSEIPSVRKIGEQAINSINDSICRIKRIQQACIASENIENGELIFKVN